MDYSYDDKCDAIIAWAEFNENFDSSAIESMKDWASDSGFFTSSQQRAIDNIIEKWNIDVDKWM